MHSNHLLWKSTIPSFLDPLIFLKIRFKTFAKKNQSIIKLINPIKFLQSRTDLKFKKKTSSGCSKKLIALWILIPRFVAKSICKRVIPTKSMLYSHYIYVAWSKLVEHIISIYSVDLLFKPKICKSR